MSGIGATRLGGLSLKPVETPSNDNPVKLKGIVWNDKVNRQPDNLNTDTNNVNVRNNGPVPSSDDLPVLFNDDNTPAQQTNNRRTETKPEYTTKKDEGMATGIGMVVGAVAGGVVGSYLGKSSGSKLGLKLGIGIGVAVGGFIGHKYE